MYYHIGWPFWKLAYRLGFKLRCRFVISKDTDHNDYFAYSPDIKGLFAESESFDEVVSAMKAGAIDFVHIDLHGCLPEQSKIKPALAFTSIMHGAC